MFALNPNFGQIFRISVLIQLVVLINAKTVISMVQQSVIVAKLASNQSLREGYSAIAHNAKRTLNLLKRQVIVRIQSARNRTVRNAKKVGYGMAAIDVWKATIMILYLKNVLSLSIYHARLIIAINVLQINKFVNSVRLILGQIQIKTSVQTAHVLSQIVKIAALADPKSVISAPQATIDSTK